MAPATQARPITDSDRDGLLFVCDANAARSQMAEGFARFIAPANMKIYSAGSTPGRLDPFAVRAMKEVGIDISNQRAKGLAEIPIKRVATIITLCPEDQCPELPKNVHHLHWPLRDPAAELGSEAETLHAFRAVRDEIRQLISRMF